MTTTTEATSSNRPTKPLTARLSSPKSDWRLYAAAGAAALAASSATDAAILYVDPAVKPDIKLPGTAPYAKNTNVSHAFAIDGVAASVAVRRDSFGNVAYGRAGAGLIGPTTASSGNVGSAKKFAMGSAIKIGSASGLGDHVLLKFATGLGGKFGQFDSNRSEFAGFQLPASDGGGFGWMRINVVDRDNDGHPDEVQVIDWAYNDAGGGITAGEGAVPEPSALGLLAIGSAGVLAWRRRNANAE